MSEIAQYKILSRRVKDTLRLTLLWSPYYRMDRFVINQHLPSEAGIYQLFIQRLNHLEELETDIAYYGGIRGTMREMTDELSPRVFPHKKEVLKEKCFCRFVTCSARKTLNQALAYLNGTAPENAGIEVSEKDQFGLIL